MRRFWIALSVAAVVLATRAPGAGASEEGTWCQGFCQSIVVGCHVSPGTVGGGPGCEAMYAACMDNCRASLPEE